MRNEELKHTVTISDEIWQELNRMKRNLHVRRIEEVIERLLKIVSIKQLKEEK